MSLLIVQVSATLLKNNVIAVMLLWILQVFLEQVLHTAPVIGCLWLLICFSETDVLCIKHQLKDMEKEMQLKNNNGE